MSIEWLIVGGILLLVIVAVVRGKKTTQDKKTTQEERIAAQKKQVALMEAQELGRVINSSLGIIQETKNIDTLKSREKLVYGHLDRMDELEVQGYNFAEKSAAETKRLLKDAVNDKLVELGKNDYDDILAKKDSYATIRAAVTAITRVQQKLVEYQRALNADAANYASTRARLQELHDSLKNEAIVGQLKELVEKADKEDFKGNSKKARDLYMDALHFLKTDSVDISKFSVQQKYIEDRITDAAD